MTACDLLVLGGSGLAGAAIVAEARGRGLSVVSASRSGGDVQVDVRDEAALRRVLAHRNPPLIINTVAMVSVADCERSPGEAWRVNARPAAIIADHARIICARVIHISTDHFYCGDGRRRHAEAEPVRLLNDYARTKYAAEAFALSHEDTLVVRTNMAGLKSATGTSFGEWAMDVIAGDKPATLFTDQHVSMLDVWSMAAALLDLAESGARGVVNLASRDVFSKAEFVTRLAEALGRPLTRAHPGSVGQQDVPRPDSLGLDVSIAQRLLGRVLPGLTEVVQALASRSQTMSPDALGPNIQGGNTQGDNIHGEDHALAV